MMVRRKVINISDRNKKYELKIFLFAQVVLKTSETFKLE